MTPQEIKDYIARRQGFGTSADEISSMMSGARQSASMTSEIRGLRRELTGAAQRQNQTFLERLINPMMRTFDSITRSLGAFSTSYIMPPSVTQARFTPRVRPGMPVMQQQLEMLNSIHGLLYEQYLVQQKSLNVMEGYVDAWMEQGTGGTVRRTAVGSAAAYAGLSHLLGFSALPTITAKGLSAAGMAGGAAAMGIGAMALLASGLAQNFARNYQRDAAQREMMRNEVQRIIDNSPNMETIRDTMMEDFEEGRQVWATSVARNIGHITRGFRPSTAVVDFFRNSMYAIGSYYTKQFFSPTNILGINQAFNAGLTGFNLAGGGFAGAASAAKMGLSTSAGYLGATIKASGLLGTIGQFAATFIPGILLDLTVRATRSRMEQFGMHGRREYLNRIMGEFRNQGEYGIIDNILYGQGNMYVQGAPTARSGAHTQLIQEASINRVSAIGSSGRFRNEDQYRAGLNRYESRRALYEERSAELLERANAGENITNERLARLIYLQSKANRALFNIQHLQAEKNEDEEYQRYAMSMAGKGFIGRLAALGRRSLTASPTTLLAGAVGLGGSLTGIGGAALAASFGPTIGPIIGALAAGHFAIKATKGFAAAFLPENVRDAFANLANVLSPSRILRRMPILGAAYRYIEGRVASRRQRQIEQRNRQFELSKSPDLRILQELTGVQFGVAGGNEDARLTAAGAFNTEDTIHHYIANMSGNSDQMITLFNENIAALNAIGELILDGLIPITEAINTETIQNVLQNTRTADILSVANFDAIANRVNLGSDVAWMTHMLGATPPAPNLGDIISSGRAGAMPRELFAAKGYNIGYLADGTYGTYSGGSGSGTMWQSAVESGQAYQNPEVIQVGKTVIIPGDTNTSVLPFTKMANDVHYIKIKMDSYSGIVTSELKKSNEYNKKQLSFDEFKFRHQAKKEKKDELEKNYKEGFATSEGKSGGVSDVVADGINKFSNFLESGAKMTLGAGAGLLAMLSSGVQSLLFNPATYLTGGYEFAKSFGNDEKGRSKYHNLLGGASATLNAGSMIKSIGMMHLEDKILKMPATGLAEKYITARQNINAARQAAKFRPGQAFTNPIKSSISKVKETWDGGKNIVSKIVGKFKGFFKWLFSGGKVKKLIAAVEKKILDAVVSRGGSISGTVSMSDDVAAAVGEAAEISSKVTKNASKIAKFGKGVAKALPFVFVGMSLYSFFNGLLELNLQMIIDGITGCFSGVAQMFGVVLSSAWMVANPVLAGTLVFSLTWTYTRAIIEVLKMLGFDIDAWAQRTFEKMDVGGILGTSKEGVGFATMDLNQGDIIRRAKAEGVYDLVKKDQKMQELLKQSQTETDPMKKQEILMNMARRSNEYIQAKRGGNASELKKLEDENKKYIDEKKASDAKKSEKSKGIADHLGDLLRKNPSLRNDPFIKMKMEERLKAIQANDHFTVDAIDMAMATHLSGELAKETPIYKMVEDKFQKSTLINTSKAVLESEDYEDFTKKLGLLGDDAQKIAGNISEDTYNKIREKYSTGMIWTAVDASKENLTKLSDEFRSGNYYNAVSQVGQQANAALGAGATAATDYTAGLYESLKELFTPTIEATEKQASNTEKNTRALEENTKVQKTAIETSQNTADAINIYMQNNNSNTNNIGSNNGRRTPVAAPPSGRN